MTGAPSTSAERKRRRIDLSLPLFAGFALFLCVLVILPLFWLVVYGSRMPRVRRPWPTSSPCSPTPT